MVRVNKSLLLLVMAAAVAAGLTLWRMGLMHTPMQEVHEAWAPEPAVAAGNDISSAPQPPISYPVEAQSAARRVGAADVGQVLIDLLGSVAVTSLLQIDEFPRRVVATVDNLASQHAPSMLWPVHPTPDRFTVDMREGGPVIGAGNSLRYTQLVLLAEAVDTSRAVDFYVRLYPLLQRAYEELGYPNRYFNDRLIAVIDLLLATPDADHPVKLQLTEVKGPITPLRPWVRYEFADPALESLSAGQKILLRVGPVNERRLKGKLADMRQELLKRAPKR